MSEQERWPVILTVGPTTKQIGWIDRDDLAREPHSTIANFLREAAGIFEQQEREA